MAAGQDTTAFDAVLKDVYLEGIREQINQNTNLLDFFTEGDVKQYEWQGRRLVLALHSARNASGVKYTAERGGLPVAGTQGTKNLFIPMTFLEGRIPICRLVLALHSARNASGVKYTAERGGLPVAGTQGTKNLFIPMTFLEGRIQLTAQVMKASRSSKGAFTTAMNLEQKGLVNDISRQRNRALAGFGQGTLAQIETGANSTLQPVKAPGGVTGTTNPTRFCIPGMLVAVIDATGVTVRGVQTILSVTSNHTLVLDGAINTTTGDLVT